MSVLEAILEDADLVGVFLCESRVTRAQRILADKPESFDYLVQHPIANHKYLVWMAEQIASGQAPQRMARSLVWAVGLFDRKRNLFKAVSNETDWAASQLDDINRWDAHSLMREAAKVKAMMLELERDPRDELDTLLDDDRYWLSRPKTHRASVWFAHKFHPEEDGRWCLSAYEDPTYYSRYSRLHFVFLWDKLKGKKFVIFPGYGYWDVANNYHKNIGDVLDPEVERQTGIDAIPGMPPARRAEVTRYGLQVWGGNPVATLNWRSIQAQAFPNGFDGSVESREKFKKWLRKQDMKIGERVQALCIFVALSRGETPEDGLASFRRREPTLRDNYILDFMLHHA